MISSLRAFVASVDQHDLYWSRQVHMWDGGTLVDALLLVPAALFSAYVFPVVLLLLGALLPCRMWLELLLGRCVAARRSCCFESLMGL